MVKDVAELDVTLTSDFNSLFDRETSQKQYLRPVVTKYWKQFPDFSKSTVPHEML